MSVYAGDWGGLHVAAASWHRGDMRATGIAAVICAGSRKLQAVCRRDFGRGPLRLRAAALTRSWDGEYRDSEARLAMRGRAVEPGPGPGLGLGLGPR